VSGNGCRTVLADVRAGDCPFPLGTVQSVEMYGTECSRRGSVHNQAISYKRTIIHGENVARAVNSRTTTFHAGFLVNGVKTCTRCIVSIGYVTCARRALSVDPVGGDVDDHGTIRAIPLIAVLRRFVHCAGKTGQCISATSRPTALFSQATNN